MILFWRYFGHPEEAIMPRTKPGEYLVVARKGRLVNRGDAATVVLRPGSVWVKVPGIQLEACFEMTQETKDGIPLRFKGGVVHRIVRPEIAAGLFDFSDSGVSAIADLIRQSCLGELRDLVSRMTMNECIEGRKTTLTESLRRSLEALVGGPEGGWGISIEVVQVAQVFIVDAGLRSQLEAETRNGIQSNSERSKLQAEETVKLARIASERRISEEALETERQRAVLEERKLELAASIDRKRDQESLETERTRAEGESVKLALRVGAERAALEAEAPVRLRRHELRLEQLREELAEIELEREKAKLEVERDFAPKRAQQELELVMLPLEQRPLIAESASHVLNGARLSVYGEDSRLVAALEPLLETLGESLRGAGSGNAGEGEK
jgi:SPFH domain / Band 7 family